MFLHLTVCKEKTVFMLNLNVLYKTVFLYKMDLALNNQQWLIFHKIKLNQTNQSC